MLRVDPRNPRAAQAAAELARRLDLSALPPELCVVIGGDGWMLSCIRELGTEPVFLGLNRGHLGFLLNEGGALDVVAERLLSRSWRVSRFPRLHAEVLGANGSMTETSAVNDVYVERSSGQTAHLRLSVDGEVLVERVVCDGVVVATALGSTAYSFSAGGVPCHPEVRAVQITPIAPHAPRLSPVLLPHGVRVEIEALSTERRPVRAVADGIDLGPVARLRVSPAEDDVKLAFFDGHTFSRTMLRKVLRS